MLTGEEAAVETVLKRICKISEDRWTFAKSKNILTYTCPYCNYSPLEEVELCYHVETYHCNDKNVTVQSCEVCYKKRKILTPDESAVCFHLIFHSNLDHHLYNHFDSSK